MNILFISTLSSERLVNKINKATGTNPGYAIQKFNRLIVRGLLENSQNVIAFSNVPITGLKKSFLDSRYEEENGIIYKYMPYIPIPMLKSLIVFLYSFFYVLFWGVRDRSNKAIICDVLSIGACLGSLIASKCIGLRSVGIVTDMPSCILSKGKISLSQRFYAWINMLYIRYFSHYVFLTKQTNDLINYKNHPYIVMEGICESPITKEELTHISKHSPPTILYAGGLNFRNGVKLLTESFIDANIDARLIIYGDGQFAAELRDICQSNNKVLYKGLAPNDVVVKDEIRSSILVNPRFLGEEYTKYSYPSKNMEFMASGTPLLTSKLPGIPDDHNPYIYIFDEISHDGYVRKLRELFAKDPKELDEFGKRARRYVLENKNYKVQSSRIIELLKTQNP